ncbi:substrate-binding domain-containing protein [Olivibacter sp. SDN3]|uniref:LacI family DNA-binding transcriptional regulator n=1 Tax=Olivibacter sp. SDN3 TaxID=2764720 RepID=UPI0016513562|nr:substrate-binding domain-containing protein [Olivibacter sp. SDN3]QNL50566.1 substrate-binding domain-containing protein [Olivibacter sp. SDN3]
MNKKVSLKDIAKAVGVSTALVSYVLNNKEKEARVGKEIAEVIRKKAAELNYQPNQIAKSLKSGKSFTIGLIVADISNPFFANIARTIEDEAKKHNYTVIFGSSDENAEKSLDLINVLVKRQVDGFIIAPTEHSEPQINYLTESNIPFVLIDRYFPKVETNYVATDNFSAAYEATTHLINNGYKHIGMIAYKSGLIHMQERVRGYTTALKDAKAGASLLKEVDYNNVSLDVEKKIAELIHARQKIDALFFATNTLSIHGLKYLNKKQWKVPGDVAVVCFDEGDAFDFFYCPLTYVEQPLIRVGKEAVGLLIEQINDHVTEKKQLALASRLVVRASSVRTK